MIIARATYKTNRIDLLVKATMGSDSDANRRAFILENYDHFRASPTFWLKVGQSYIIPPRPL